ncbi:Molybdopterin-guanine dinucleotide biosynthesis protein B [Serratia entomophila]|jgi:molybdopterin-guanine dinucleotide biosynthesis protein B|uniref:Molybdopterin-guanine dinucleotide biosynthesis protein B n=1 Tax=Serratia entomophila TaxID=42906 RepID=A0ABY5CT87_9GAMM|nr:molybdopterin-guanine dinucleotide biosynthesis protein MobB [Serratia entomophila]UIW18279.1 molybdopterin-guanine dinucleotide biosynthesis protein B [Serratia entomophila]USV00945.1 molybdopterin-guanine dinucleotide biosynthesis protein B [Serratia entomophila]CAI0790194.1 Molybdopterin-guanine dinucleotide biosynthesis protein B [Serratia entomophila]CAI1089866.1 Molybdopterin-guanine dinucleotide biosynthesis protein B [Serratia entomophila]CAI1092605.1 Molybdopterin-guanine dinucleot
MNNSLPPLLAIGAYSGTGKTTLLKQLIPLLKQRQVRVGLIKHTHHNMDVDTPGKDSYELRKAGADQTLVASDSRWALMTETPEQQPLDLQYLASRFDADKVDLILVEGFKHEPIGKIILYREEIGRPLEEMLDEFVLAVASDRPVDMNVRSLDINRPESIADFIMEWLKGAA